MKRPLFLLSCALALPPAALDAQFSTSEFSIAVDRTGMVTGLYDAVHRTEYLAHPSPLVAVLHRGNVERPSRARFLPGDTVRLYFEGRRMTIDVAVSNKPGYVTFEIVRAVPVDSIDGAIWGPYATTIGTTVGEIVGVVRNDRFAIGIQALNPKTLRSYPDSAEGFDLSRSRAAERKPWGSVLQCYSLNRTRPRTANVWLGNFPNMPVLLMAGEKGPYEGIFFKELRSEDSRR